MLNTTLASAMLPTAWLLLGTVHVCRSAWRGVICPQPGRRPQSGASHCHHGLHGRCPLLPKLAIVVATLINACMCCAVKVMKLIVSA